jgi:uncharacterized OB-fold protein
MPIITKANERPLPVVDCDSESFWNAARAGRLQIQRCKDCTRHIFYPRVLCPNCHSDRLELVTSAGTGTVYSYTIARRPASPAFAAQVPYVVVLVDLDEGVRMLSNLIVDDLTAVRIGARVRVRFEDVTDTVALPLFELLDGRELLEQEDEPPA